MTTTSEKTRRMVGIAIFAAIIIALQMFATAVNYVTPGTIPIALVLPPLVIGAAMYGVKAGAVLGFCFGIVVVGSGIFGFAPTSAMMWNVNPIIFVVGTLGRGLAVGFVAGATYKLFARKDIFMGVWAAAIIAPIINTGIFIFVLFLFVEILVTADEPVSFLQRLITAFVGINFMMEMVVNIVIAPAISRIIRVGKKMR
ncbi:MAG: hypothetical protein FWC93_03850 [Defluviitaleaceae bacterium]|nr:hypothetical protein [Defluviitaleaceae bacterium]